MPAWSKVGPVADSYKFGLGSLDGHKDGLGSKKLTFYCSDAIQEDSY